MENIEETISLSLILPSLNVADYIEETLKSACDQSIKNIEILCIDAGSTDGTLDIINKYSKLDARVSIINSDKRSYGYQVNLGLDAAHGRYIAVLETDDFVDPAMYKKLYEIAEMNRADYVKADYDAFITQNDGSYYFFPRRSLTDVSLYDKVLCPKDNPEIGRNDWYLWQGIYSTEFIRKNNIRFTETPGAAFQDIGFLYWTGVSAERAVYIRDVFYHYRIDRETASSNSGKGLKFSYAEFSCIRERLGDLDRVDKKELRLLYARMAKSFISCYGRIDESNEARNERQDMYLWFKNELRTAISKEILTDDIIFPGHLDKLKILLESEERYFEKYSVNVFDQKICKNFSFAIFGCGDFGYKVYHILFNSKKNIICYLDNKESLWGKSINGVEIKSPEEAIKLSEDVMIVLANEAHYDDMQAQLLGMGLPESRMCVFS